MSLACVLTNIGEIIAPYLDDADVTRLAQTSKQLRRLRTPLLRQVVSAHLGGWCLSDGWRAVGRRFFDGGERPTFSMYQSLSEVVVCDFRAGLWSDVELCLGDPERELAPLREYVGNALARVRAAAMGCFGTKVGRDCIIRQSRLRPVQYPSRDAKLVVDAVARDVVFHARRSFVVGDDGAVSVSFGTSPALAAVLAAVGDRVPRWFGVVIRVARRCASERRREFYASRLELE